MYRNRIAFIFLFGVPLRSKLYSAVRSHQMTSALLPVAIEYNLTHPTVEATDNNSNSDLGDKRQGVHPYILKPSCTMVPIAGRS
ncbi:hypothetical protein GDO78_001298 [Eleutherodactylus coqui]|uniref:Uncharacterized protein n=1 Tax=Eleutherodactylus coqui TaxID=57060 RepID=A0A8J6FV94_ELECQ|nr:hypothetical protein GDO78_001298 [Eleutherodactylus coqui]